MNQLSAPVVTPRPGGWEFDWAEEGIFIRLERLREHGETVTAELWAEQGEKREHLRGGLRFNLVTNAGRESMAKGLAARRNGIDWSGIMEQICVYALRQFRSQEQSLEIGGEALGPVRDLEFCLKPVLPKDVTTILWGYGGVAKTTMATAWGLLVQLGYPALGLLPVQGPVMLLDWETNWQLANRLLKQVHAGMGLPETPHFIYRRVRRPLSEFIEDVIAEVAAKGVSLIILDSLIKACGGEREAKENGLATMNLIGQIPATPLVISHRPKGLEGRERGSYGSVMIENDCRQSWRMESPSSESGTGNTAQVVLFHEKHNLMARLQPMGFVITWDKLLGIKIERQEPSTMADIRPVLSAISQIQTTLREGGEMTVGEIEGASKLPLDTIKKTLARHPGIFANTNPGNRPAKYALIEDRGSPEVFK